MVSAIVKTSAIQVLPNAGLKMVLYTIPTTYSASDTLDVSGEFGTVFGVLEGATANTYRNVTFTTTTLTIVTTGLKYLLVFGLEA